MEPSGFGSCRRTLYHGDDGLTGINTLSPEEKDSVRLTMLERLSKSAAHFAHRQRDDPDLTQQEKIDIASGILQKNPAVFLRRFGAYLQAVDLAYFQDSTEDDYEIQFHIREIQHRCSNAAVIVKNRRFAAMQELEVGGEYFSEEAMKRREPLLYEQMVGQYLTEEEKLDKEVDHSDLRLSTILMKHMEEAQEKSLYKQQKEEEECQEEESEDSSEEEEKEEDEEMKDDEIPEISNKRATDVWHQQLHAEFKSIMQEKFMSGKDSDFDYRQIDSNPDYDSMVAKGRDEEDRYFALENPKSVGHSDSDSDVFCAEAQSTAEKAEGNGSDEDDDYMKYEPSAELVAKSMKFKNSGSWMESCEDMS